MPAAANLQLHVTMHRVVRLNERTGLTDISNRIELLGTNPTDAPPTPSFQFKPVADPKSKLLQIWYFALHPEAVIDEKRAVGSYVDDFNAMGSLPRAEQKRRLRDVIERNRSDAGLMGDPKTDARPLVLGAR